MTITKEEIKERIRKVAEKCWTRILLAEVDKLNEGNVLTTLQRLDIYQEYRDKACNRICPETMFWADFYDLFDEVYKEVEANHEWEALVCC